MIGLSKWKERDRTMYLSQVDHAIRRRLKAKTQRDRDEEFDDLLGYAWQALGLCGRCGSPWSEHHYGCFVPSKSTGSI